MKNGDLSVIFISTSIFGQVSISSLHLKASLYLYNICMTCFFSGSDRHDFSKSTYLSSISLSDVCLLSSPWPNYGYLSFVSSFSFFNVFINLINHSHQISADLTLYVFTEILLLNPLFYLIISHQSQIQTT